MEIVKIGAMWCPGCIVMNKVWDKIQKEYNINITSYDLDFDSDKIDEYNVGSVLPVIIFYNNGEEVKRLVGEKKYEDIENVILEMRNLNE